MCDSWRPLCMFVCLSIVLLSLWLTHPLLGCVHLKPHSRLPFRSTRHSIPNLFRFICEFDPEHRLKLEWMSLLDK